MDNVTALVIKQVNNDEWTPVIDIFTGEYTTATRNGVILRLATVFEFYPVQVLLSDSTRLRLFGKRDSFRVYFAIQRCIYRIENSYIYDKEHDVTAVINRIKSPQNKT